MLSTTLRKVFRSTPPQFQRSIKRIRFERLIESRRYFGEPEYLDLPNRIKPGDWVMDIGANIGAFATEFSRLVGPSGRVFAFEPIFETFGYLTNHLHRQGAQNVSLFNVAVSNKSGLARMDVPKSSAGMEDHYQAHLNDDGGYAVWTLAIDSLGIEHPITLVKIDVEGHEVAVLEGMRNLLLRDKPYLIVEINPAAGQYLEGLGYKVSQLEGSPNLVAEYPR